MNLDEEFFSKEISLNYKFENKLNKNKQSIYNLFFTCTCSTVLGTSYTLMRQPLTLYPTISYMAFLFTIKEILKREQIMKQYQYQKELLKIKKFVRIKSS